MSVPHDVTELCYSHGCPDHQEVLLPNELLRWWIDAAESSSDKESFSSLVAITKRYFEDHDREFIENGGESEIFCFCDGTSHKIH